MQGRHYHCAIAQSPTSLGATNDFSGAPRLTRRVLGKGVHLIFLSQRYRNRPHFCTFHRKRGPRNSLCTGPQKCSRQPGHCDSDLLSYSARYYHYWRSRSTSRSHQDQQDHIKIKITSQDQDHIKITSRSTLLAIKSNSNSKIMKPMDW